ncbi:hypothetical protein KAFR_0D00790 [Kazachstania africana CBS 2517]|uniref:Major facilitator superfamily (MFS) profile domain-containing protein n=1 Tax=Kazachstania africana (strain ATCC 22294 / BCRC 22015 / CBS 2517 / CECT 1963 / NBRC 1671 / NRRL Y-8276) TaxID=1071382 RepID=H2ATM6_KAZAF|nr:hypothetical protein KAFR_0D00790 [Kazachstania africana CBS 2517]CCF57726.1 hypothetical protein KAFR_0D00790 [Kazachstania africana CBS 2517]
MTAEQQSVQELDASVSNRSQQSTVSNKVSDNEIKDESYDEQAGQEITLPKKPISAYSKFIILSLCVAFGGFIFGWDTGTISGFVAQTDFLQRFGELNSSGEYYLSNVREGLIVGIFNIGCAFGGIILSKLGDMYGRKIGLTCVTIIYIVGQVICIASVDKWYQYFIGRIVAGLGVGGIAVLSPMLISETSPKHLRGTLVSCYQLMCTAGIFLGYCTNYGTSKYSNSVQWRVALGISFAWALFMIGGLTFVPESPRYLCEKDRIEDAKKAIAMSNKVSVDDPAVQAEVDAIMASLEAERAAGNASWGELFSPKGKILQRLIMGVMLQALQQLTGDNYFFYYGTTIFQAVGMTNSFETAIVLGIVNFASTFVSLYVIDRYGRRTCLLWGAASMAVCMVIYASVGVKSLYPHGRSNPSSKSAGDVMIVFTCLYIFCFATTWGPCIWVLISETYPLRIRSKGMALATASNWIWGFLISFFTPFINSAIHFAYGYVFLGCLVFSWFYVFFIVPETKGLTLEEIEEMWITGVLPWKSNGWVPAARRGAEFDAEDFTHDDKPWYKAML